MKRLTTLAAIAVLASFPATAAPYTLFIYEAADQLALRPAKDAAATAYWTAYDVFGKELAAAGVLRGGSALNVGAPLAQVAGATDLDASKPYAASPLALGGYFQIDVASDADAIAWARKLPAVAGVVEVRAGYPAPGMAM